MIFFRIIKIIVVISVILTAGLFASDLNLPNPITSHLSPDYDPSFSPNGRYVAYTSTRSGNEDIWVIDLKTKKGWQVTKNSSSEYSPFFWGNDRILFVSTKDNAGGEIFVSDIKGTKAEKLIGGPGSFDSPAMSPNNKEIAYVSFDVNSQPVIYFYDIKSRVSVKGPPGKEPSFSPSGDSIAYIDNTTESSGAMRLAIYDIKYSQSSFLKTGEGIDTHPVYNPDGAEIIFSKRNRDTDNNGKINLDDIPNIGVLKLNDSNTSYLYYGYGFDEPTISSAKTLAAVGSDDDIYALSLNGLTPKLKTLEDQQLFADSISKRALTYQDSLVSADANYSAYKYFPDSCKNSLIHSAEIYGELNLRDLARMELPPALSSNDINFQADAEMVRTWLDFQDGLENLRTTGWDSLLSLTRRLVADEALSPEIQKKAFIKAVIAGNIIGDMEASDSFISQGMERYPSDSGFVAYLQLLKLRNMVSGFAGDPLDLIVIYVNYIDNFGKDAAWSDSAIGDIIDITRKEPTDIATGMLESIRNSFSDYNRLSAFAALEQADRFFYSGQKITAEWKYNEVISNYPDEKDIMFYAFERLGDLARIRNDFLIAKIYYDSSGNNMQFIDSEAERRLFREKSVSLLISMGDEILATDAKTAHNYYSTALKLDQSNIRALWGIAKSVEITAEWDNWKKTAKIIKNQSRRKYFEALEFVARFKNEKSFGYLNKARKGLLAARELDFKDPSSYLSLGYINCLLEQNSTKPLGLYEETIDLSLTGIALSSRYLFMKAGFYLNAAEGFYGIAQYQKAFENYLMAMRIDSTVIGQENKIPYLMHYGESAFQNDSLIVAKTCYSSLYSKAVELSDSKNKGKYAIKLGMIYQLLNDYDTALKYYEAALLYFDSIKDHVMLANVCKGEAICYQAIGDQARALSIAQKGIKELALAKNGGITEDDRVRLIITFLNISIPTIKLPSFTFGGSLYPDGFTKPANHAFLLSVAEDSNNRLVSIMSSKEKLQLLENNSEWPKLASAWSQLGRDYYQIGIPDSARSCFEHAYDISMKKLDFISAYTDLLNWSEIVLSADYMIHSSAYPSELDRLNNQISKLLKNIQPSFYIARANLKNIKGIIAFNRVLYLTEVQPLQTSAGLEQWLNNSNKLASDAIALFQESSKLFQDAIADIPYGREPAMMTVLLSNHSIVSKALSDSAACYSDISSAMPDARQSLSETIYAKFAGIYGLYINPDSAVGSIRGAIESYENLIPSHFMQADIQFVNSLYGRAFVLSMQKNDVNEALSYLERQCKYNLLARASLYPLQESKNRLFSVYIDQVRDYTSRLTELKAAKRRLEQLGSQGQIELKKTNDQLSRLRLRLADMQNKALAADTTLASFILFDSESPLSLQKNISADELYLIPIEQNNGINILALDKDNINSFMISQTDDSLPPPISKILEKRRVVTVASLGSAGSKLRNLLYKYSPQTIIKSAYSINDCLEWQNKDYYALENICRVKFDGSILNALTIDSLNAVDIIADTLILNKSINGFGWIVIDGHLNYDSGNPLLSFWEYSHPNNSNTIQQRIYVTDIFKISMNGFGLIITGFPSLDKASDKWLILKSLAATGVGGIITLSDSLNEKETNNYILSYFKEAKDSSPVDALSTVYRTTSSYNSKYETANYFGNSGWNSKDKQTIKASWFRQSIALADSAASAKDWKKAAKYFDAGLAQWDGSWLSSAEKYRVMDRAVGAYLKGGEIEKALTNQKAIINGLFWPLKAQAKMWQDYARIARNGKQYSEERLALNRSIEIGFNSGDSSLVTNGYLNLARYYSDIKNPDEMNKYSSLAVMLAESTRNDTLKADAYFMLGQSLYMAKEFLEAETNLSNSLPIYLKYKDYGGAYRAAVSISKIYNSLHYYGRENTILQDAEKYSLASGDSALISRCRLLLSHSYLINGNPRRALSQLEGLPDNNNYRIQIYLEKSEIYQWTGQADSALLYAQNALNSASGDGRPIYHTIHEQIGDILRQKNDYDGALDQYGLAFEYIKNDSLIDKDYYLEYKLAVLHAILGDNADSLLQNISKSTSDEFLLALCEYQLALINEKRGDENKASELFLSVAPHNNPAVTRFVKWRAFYHLGKLRKGARSEEYWSSADSIIKIIPPEPQYFINKYFLDCDIPQFYEEFAKVKINANNLYSSLACFEDGFMREIASEHIQNGKYDSIDESILDNCLKSFENDSIGNYKKYLENIGKDNPQRFALWAGYNGDPLDLKKKLDDSHAIVRLFQTPAGLNLFYMDEDTLIYSRVTQDTALINRNIGSFSELMKYQDRADSALEYWYKILIAPFEKQMEQKTDLIICPDFEWMEFPFEALKRPGAAYLNDMYSITRSIGLPPKIQIQKGEKYMPCIIDDQAIADNAIMAVMGIAEAVGKCDDHYDRIVITNHSYIEIAGNGPAGANSILSEIPHNDLAAGKEAALGILLAGRDGYCSFLKPLWQIPDQSLSYYYWKLLTDLRDGMELTRAVGEANSYNFGLYKGLPYYWAFSPIYKISLLSQRCF